MKKSRLLGVVFLWLVVSFNASADIISIDWKTSGDNLVTRDTVSGLDWLDLTETNGLSFNYVGGQITTGGQFEGWHVASGLEVVDLFANFGIDLSLGAPNILLFLDPAVVTATGFLGNIVPEDPALSSDHPYGVLGVTSDTHAGFHLRLGVVQSPTESPVRTYYHVYGDTNNTYGSNFTYLHTGTFLVRASVVPVPPALYLFGSGLLGLAGVARKKAASTTS